MATEFVKSGYWLDHQRSSFNCYQLLCTDRAAFILTNFIAVLITSASSRVFILVIHPLDKLWKRMVSIWNPLVVVQDSLEDANDWFPAVEELFEDISVDDLLPLAWGGAPNGRPLIVVEISAKLFMTVLLLGPPLLFLIASILSGGLATDPVALANSPSCGEYAYNFAASRSSQRFLQYERSAEAQSSLYAEQCYGNSSLEDGCTTYYNQSIGYSVEPDVDCPFDGDVCQDGPQSAFRSTTGLVSGSVLGINAANPFFFRRTMTCSPLIATDKYVKSALSDQGEPQWEYWYGKSDADYTSANPVRESNWEIKGYSTGIYCSNPSSRNSVFEPASGFTASFYPVTILFISSHKLLYPERRDDSVFPARDEMQIEGDYKADPFFYNNSTRAGILGCVDEHLLCRSPSGPCWNNGNFSSMPAPSEGRNATEEENVAYLLLLAMGYSTSCGSIQYRGADALDAQLKVADIQSLALAQKQWQVEAEKMFQTSLARMKLNVFDTLRGTVAAYEGYENILPPEYSGICGLVKFRARGWTNVNLFGIVSIVVVNFIIFIISITKKSISGDEHLIAVWIWLLWVKPMCQKIPPLLKKLKNWMAPIPGATWSALLKLITWVDTEVLAPLSERILI